MKHSYKTELFVCSGDWKFYDENDEVSPLDNMNRKQAAKLLEIMEPVDENHGLHRFPSTADKPLKSYVELIVEFEPVTSCGGCDADGCGPHCVEGVRCTGIYTAGFASDAEQVPIEDQELRDHIWKLLEYVVDDYFMAKCEAT